MITFRTDAKFDELERLIDRITRPGNSNLRKISDGVRRAFQENFTTEGAASGAPWRPLAPRTVATRQQLGWPSRRPVLVRTGRYRRSFVQPGGDHIEQISSGSLGTTIDVGSELANRIHERGGTTSIPSWQQGRSGWMHVGGGRNVFVPKRSVLGLGDRQEERLYRLLDYVIDHTERQFWR
jgi:phage gpG-like protein